MKTTLRYRAFQTLLHSRFVAREDDLNRRMSDDEVRAEARYLLETIPYAGIFEGDDLKKAIRQLKRLLKEEK